MRFERCILPAVALLLYPVISLAQTPAAPGRGTVKYAWAPKPVPATPWVAPNRPHWKLSELIAAHAGKPSWSQDIVRDPGGLSAQYIQLAPGEHTKTLFYPDTGVFWIVQAGQMRVSIEGQDPFVASKGFFVQVPYRIPFSMETVGDTPVLYFEVTRTGALPLYPLDQTPTPIKGQKYVKVAYGSGPGKYEPGTKPYLDFYKDVPPFPARTPHFITIDTTAAGLNRQPSVPRPPDSDLGHFHIGTSEFFFILDGQVSFQIEGTPFFTADQGDVVYAPANRWHRATSAGTGSATRISTHPVPNALQVTEPKPDASSGGD